MFLPVWFLVVSCIFVVVFGMSVYLYAIQKGYEAGLKAFYRIKEINHNLGINDNAV